MSVNRQNDGSQVAFYVELLREDRRRKQHGGGWYSEFKPAAVPGSGKAKGSKTPVPREVPWHEMQNAMLLGGHPQSQSFSF